MSIEKIFEKLEIFEKKIEALEQLKPMILSSENLCGQCVNDLLYFTRQEIKKNRSAAQTSTSASDVDDYETNTNEIEKGQEPEKEMDTSSFSDVTSQIDEEAILVEEEEEPFAVDEEDEEDIVVEEEENANEEGGVRILPGTSVAAHRARHADKSRKDLRDIVKRLVNFIEKDSGNRNTILHVIQALNAKLYLDKARRSRHNLDQLPSFDDISRPSSSPEFSPTNSTITFASPTPSLADAAENVPTAEDVFAIFPKFHNDENDVVEDTSAKKPFIFEPFKKDDFARVKFNFDFKNNYGKKN